MPSRGSASDAVAAVVASRGDPRVDRTLAGRYRLLRRVGAGGMGVVYEAEHVLLGRRVAVKTLHATYAADERAVRRFWNEARAAAQIGHPHIAAATDLGRDEDGSLFVVYELLEGRDLAEELAAEGALPVARATTIARQVAGALAAAHARAIVHRDIKPRNVFLVRRDEARGDHAKVLDFGVSKYTADEAGVGTTTDAVVGTPAYMAPEQLEDPRGVDARADVYALGALVFEMLAGRPVFAAPTLPRLARSIADDVPPRLDALRPDVPRTLADLVARALAKAPSDRVASMEAFGRALDALAGDDDATAPAATVSATRATRRRVSTRGAIAVAGLAVAAGLGAVVAATVARRAARTLPALQPVAATREATVPTSVPAAPRHVTLEVQGTPPRARVLLRGEVHDAPLALQVPPGTAAEVVEVEAPGYQRCRYSITLDRDRSLHVRLVPGTGSAEATHDETSLALGELVPVAPTDALDRAPRAASAPRVSVRAPVVPPGLAQTAAPGRTVAAAAPGAPESAAPAAPESSRERPSNEPARPAATPAARSDAGGPGIYAGPRRGIPEEI